MKMNENVNQVKAGRYLVHSNQLGPHVELQQYRSAYFTSSSAASARSLAAIEFRVAI